MSRVGVGDPEPAVRIRLLGTFGVWVAGDPVSATAWRLRKAKDIVKLLALAPGHRRHREELTETLWPGRDQAAAANNLHQTLHAARRALDRGAGEGRRYLQMVDDCVVLCPEDDVWVDVEQFESAVAAARETDDPSALEKALGLYGGELLPEDRYEDWASGQRESLRFQRRTLLAALAGHLLVAGDARRAVGLLQGAVADEPTDESSQRALMLAYAVVGDRQAALRQFQALRAVLRDDLGLDPDSASERLHREILTGTAESTLHAGLSTQAELAMPGQPASPSRHRGGGTSQRNLPVRLSSFVGRQNELAAVTAMLIAHRLVTLTGTGGCGKTRLAVEVAEGVASLFPGGVHLVELAVVSDEAAVSRELATALSVREPPGGTPLTAVAEHIGGRRTLLLVDNCEHVVGGAAQMIEGLLMACPALVVLATSREPLRATGEVIWRVPSLALPDRVELAVAVLTRSDSVRLFVDRATAAEAGFALDETNAGDVGEICHRLDGLPLALELAAARVPALGVRGIAERLDDRFRLLTSGTRTALSRQRTLAATFDWSHDLLSEPERVVFRRLAVFAGSFPLDAAVAVCAAGDVDAADVAGITGELADRSLVVAEQHGPDRVFRLIGSLQEYGRRRLADAAETREVSRRHARWHLALVEEAAGHFAEPDRHVWFARLDTHHDDLRASSDHLLVDEPGDALRLGAAMWPYWVLRGMFGEGLQRLNAALDASSGADRARLGALLGAFALGARWCVSRDLETYPPGALELAQTLDDPVCSVRAMCAVGIWSWLREDFDMAGRQLREAVETARRAGLVMAEASAVHALAVLEWTLGRPDNAHRHLGQALALARRGVETGDGGSLSALTVGGLASVWRGPVPHLVFEETYIPFQDFTGPAAVAYVTASLGSLARSRGDHSTAQGLFEEALAVFEEAGDLAGVAMTGARLGNLAIVTRDAPRAREQLTRILEVFRDLRDARGVGLVLMSLGRLAADQGHVAEARERYREAESVFRPSGDIPGLVGVLARLGDLGLVPATDDSSRSGAPTSSGLPAAVHDVEEAVSLARTIGSGAHLGMVLADLAELYAAAGARDKAVLAAVEALEKLPHAPLGPGRERAESMLTDLLTGC